MCRVYKQYIQTSNQLHLQRYAIVYNDCAYDQLLYEMYNQKNRLQHNSWQSSVFQTPCIYTVSLIIIWFLTATRAQLSHYTFKCRESRYKRQVLRLSAQHETARAIALYTMQESFRSAASTRRLQGCSQAYILMRNIASTYSGVTTLMYILRSGVSRPTCGTTSKATRKQVV